MNAGVQEEWPAPPESLLAEDVIELRLIRIMDQSNVSMRSAEAQFISAVEYRFAIHRRSDGVRVGRIHIRLTRDEGLLRAIGHSGYAVDEAQRRRGYATRAIRLIVGLGRFWGILPLWVLIEPENIASRGAVEKAGFTLVDIVEATAEARALGVGARVCRYRFLES